MSKARIRVLNNKEIDIEKVVGLVIGAGMLGWSIGSWFGVVALVAIAAFLCFKDKVKIIHPK